MSDVPSTIAPVRAKSAMQKAMEKLGLKRDLDFALHLPLRYEDQTHITALRDVRDDQTVLIEATVVDSQVQLSGRRQLIVMVEDAGVNCVLRFFHFYPALQKLLSPGAHIRAHGPIKASFMGLSMMHPSVKVADGPLPAALTPVYSTVSILPQTYLRKAVLGGLNRADRAGDLSETLPASHQNAQLWPLRDALWFLHTPTPDVSLTQLEDRSHPAWQRLKAEELLAQQLSQHQSRAEHALLSAPPLHAHDEGLQARLLAALPFQLTGAQQRVCEEIAADLAQGIPMHRLLQGDVGSGKTIVAAIAALRCIDAGWQCALMAPTEILAQQHFQKLVQWLEPLGVRVAWLTGQQKTKEKRLALEGIASGEMQLVIGTHAVIQSKVVFKNLALAIIDEQHRFGVQQRLALREKMSPGLQHSEPHLLMMSATPIPRTLAMSYYADLNVSTLDELPPGRTPVITKLVSDQRRDEVIARIRAQLAQGRQIYWVCPLIEESEALDLVNATATHEALSLALGDTTPVGLLHSRMPAAEKQAVMDEFKHNRMGVLVSTTVIEVGVDVPNASLMVIEHAERFGLSQLHQLRGRVGRGAAASACILLYANSDGARLSETARERLKAMAQTQDGFEIAKRDLEIRGPGEFLGARQSGTPLLRFADLQADLHWLQWARQLAPLMLTDYPELAEKHMARWLGGKAAYLKA